MIIVHYEVACGFYYICDDFIESFRRITLLSEVIGELASK